MHEKIAGESFSNGFNCAQSVVSTYAPGLGISRELSLKLAAGLGAGGNYNGKICGAVIGAFMVLGLKYGTDKANHKEAKERLRSKLDAFTNDFKKEFGSIECNVLLNADISNPDDLQRLRDEKVFRNFCSKIVTRVDELIENTMVDENA